MLKINIQLFAHKKGGGSTKNGRDSESKRLGVKFTLSSSNLPEFLKLRLRFGGAVFLYLTLKITYILLVYMQ